VTFVAAIVFLAMRPIEANLRFISASFYLAFAAIVAYTRHRTRLFRNIKHGDFLTDACIAVLFYPLALVQHEKELRAPDNYFGGAKASAEEEKRADDVQWDGQAVDEAVKESTGAPVQKEE
jgi:hypothetical protein